MNKFILIFTCLFSFTLLNSFAQSTITTTDSEEYNRWSMSLYGGYIYGERDRGLQVFASRFNVVSSPSYSLGGDLRYALNSFWSIEGGYRYSTLEGGGFETTMHSASVKTSLNLNRFYRRNIISEYVNPYIIAGVEQDFFSAEGPDDQFSRSEASLIGGAGIALRLSDRIEFFGQHEIKLSSNHLDLTDQGYPYDQIGMSTGGVRIHFGRSDRRPMNLKPATRQISDQEYDDIFARTQDASGLSEDVETLENQITRIESENNGKLDNLLDRIATLETQIDSLKANTDCLCGRMEQTVTDSGPEEEPEPEHDLRRTVPAGHYVQVYASRGYNSALEVREQFRELLNNELENPQEVFIIHRQQFYEVMIGTYGEFSDAQRILEPSSGVMTDSFIITFLRPAHLEDHYEGTVIIHD